MNCIGCIHACHMEFWWVAMSPWHNSRCSSAKLLPFHMRCVSISTTTHTCHTPCPSHYSAFSYPNNTGWGVQFAKLLIMQSPPVPLTHPFQATISSSGPYSWTAPKWETKFHTHTRQNARITVLYPLRHKTRSWMCVYGCRLDVTIHELGVYPLSSRLPLPTQSVTTETALPL